MHDYVSVALMKPGVMGLHLKTHQDENCLRTVRLHGLLSSFVLIRAKLSSFVPASLPTLSHNTFCVRG